jgi:cytochrome P450
MLPHSFLLGHLLVVTKLMLKQPRNLSGLYAPLLVAREYPELANVGLLYMDMWPISPPMLAVFHPEIMAQFTQDVSLPKHPLMKSEFTPFTGCNDLVNQHGLEWKTWRSIFNPGFSAKNLLTFAPEMVDEVLIFKEWLKDMAKSGEVKPLEHQATRVTIDIIGRAVL